MIAGVDIILIKGARINYSIDGDETDVQLRKVLKVENV